VSIPAHAVIHSYTQELEIWIAQRLSGRAMMLSMKKRIDLMTLFWTTSGAMPPEAETSRFGFEDRVKAAARAGFKGIGIWHTDLQHVLQSTTLKDMRRILDDNGMKYLELEFLTDWFVDGARKLESDGRKKLLLEASAALGAHHVKVGDFSNTPCPLPRIIEAFAALCREAEGFGATIGFEFMKSAVLDNLKDSLAMVESAGCKNGGLVLDIVHVVNLGITNEELRRIPLRYLVNVELNDGTLPGSPNEDPSRARRLCGEGEFDIKGFIACLLEMGYAGPWAVEVFSKELAALPLEEITERAFTTTLAQFSGV
jgi:sugar phosphate isomerase/epimerase